MATGHQKDQNIIRSSESSALPLTFNFPKKGRGDGNGVNSYHVYVKVAQLGTTLRFHGLYSPWKSPGQDTRVGSLSLLQRIFLTQESNQGLLDCKQILYQLSYQGSEVYMRKPL